MEPSSRDFGNELTETQTYELLEELELNRPENVQGARENAALKIRCKVAVEPANVCDRANARIEAAGRDLQRQGVTCVCDVPLMVGSLFRVTFERAVVDLPPVLATCDRCTMLNDSAFESHFRFEHPIQLPRNA